MLVKTFYPFYKERIAAITNKIQKEIYPMEMLSSTVWVNLNSILYEIMHKVAVRTLIVEMHECLKKGIIIPSNRKEEYLAFMELLDRADYRKDILNRYVGLSELLDNLGKNQYQFWSEFFFRMKKDWQLLNKLMNDTEKSLHIESLEMNASDPHLKGRMVIQITTDSDRRFFYKPHGMGNETFLQALIDKIGRAHGWKSYCHKIIDMDTYGWAEGIPCCPCDSEEEIKLFYQKSGMLAAVSYVLGIGDLHYENIIANKADPVIVDAETLFQHMGPIYQWKEKAAVFYSPLTSGLFPGGNVGKNVSGIMGGEEYLYEKEVPVILNDQTSEMRIGYAKPRLKEGKNRVRYKNENVEIFKYDNDVIHGFDITYQWFLRHHKQVMEMILKREKGLYSRYISGATQFFGMGLSASTHPQLLMDPNGRKQYLDKITNGRPLNIWEKEAMLEGDIPWFGRHLNDRHLYSGQEVVKPDFFEHTLSEELEQRLEQLTYEDNLLQQKVLKSSIDLFGKEEKWINASGSRIMDIEISDFASSDWRKEEALLSVKRIADEIMNKAIRCKGTIFWLSVTNIGEHLVIKPVDHYFYSGIAGVAVFFRKLCTFYPEYGEVCSVLEQMLFSYTDKVSNKEITPNTQYTGMYCGESSVAYAYQLLYRITNDNKYLLYAGKHLQAITVYIAKDRKFDLLYGNVGITLVLCQQYLYTNDLCYRNEAVRALEILDRNCEETESGAVWQGEGSENSVCSTAHGNSGILLAYARLNSIMPDPHYIKRMKQIVSYENQFYDVQTGNWADLRKKGEDIYNTYSWCNGGLGVLYARMQAAKWNPEEKWLKKEVEKIIPLSKELRIRDGMCLCHGNMGNLIIMREISEYMTSTEIEDTVKRFGDIIFSGLRKDVMPQMAQERYNVGLMNGLAGIGLGII